MTVHNPEESGEADSLSTDTVHSILSQRRRRDAIDVVRTEGGMSLRELTEHVAAREETTAVGEAPQRAEKRVYVSLHQCHLPKLDENGVLVYDTEEKQIEQGPHIETCGWHLDNGPAKHSSAVFKTVRSFLSA